MDAIRIEHVAIWVRDLEGMCHFYVAMLGAKTGAPYHNPRNGFRSIFLSFGDGARVELMSQSGQVEDRSEASGLGYAHLALRLGTRAAVDGTVARLESQGVVILSRPRVTGDGYYEAVLADPEGNRIELMAQTRFRAAGGSYVLKVRVTGLKDLYSSGTTCNIGRVLIQ